MSGRIAKWILACALLLVGAAAPAAEAPAASGATWPQRFAKDGNTLVVYQPQMESWQNRLRLDARVAVAVLQKGATTPVAGVLEISARTDADLAKGRVALSDVQITAAHFPAGGAGDVETIARDLFPPSGLVLSLDYLLAKLALSTEKIPGAAVANAPPTIFVSEQPARLVVFEGKPVFAAIESTGLKYALNTNWPVFQGPDGYYLLDETGWLTTEELEGGTWSYTSEIPADFDRLPDKAQWEDVRARIPAAPSDSLPPLDFFVSTTPAELIVLVGEVDWAKIEGTGLFYARNTNSLLFWEGSDREYYYLVSGRWFRSKSLDGPWQYANPNLPKDFAAVPADGPLAAVRAAVPGTVEAREAVFRATIPRLAVIDRQTARATVTYAGAPIFAPIEGTSLSYAVNSPDDIVRVDDVYYLCQNGVWFTAPAPSGPWTVADSVPEQIYAIPIASPLYNTTYVRLYGVDGQYATYGYTEGYRGAYVGNGFLVWGSGYDYPPYVGVDAVPAFFPRPYTYGCDAYYDPLRGVFRRAGYGYGPHGGVGAAAVYNPYTGTYARGVVAHGPEGSVAAGEAVNPRTGLDARGVRRADPYAAWQEAVVPRGARITQRDAAGGDWPTSARAAERDVYAAADGSLYRRDGDRWTPFTVPRRQVPEAPSGLEQQRTVPREDVEQQRTVPRQAEVVTTAPMQQAMRMQGGGESDIAAQQRRNEEERDREMEMERAARERAAANAERARAWGGSSYRDLGGGRFAGRGRR